MIYVCRVYSFRQLSMKYTGFSSLVADFPNLTTELSYRKSQTNDQGVPRSSYTPSFTDASRWSIGSVRINAPTHVTKASRTNDRQTLHSLQLPSTIKLVPCFSSARIDSS